MVCYHEKNKERIAKKTLGFSMRKTTCERVWKDAVKDIGKNQKERIEKELVVFENFLSLDARE